MGSFRLLAKENASFKSTAFFATAKYMASPPILNVVKPFKRIFSWILSIRILKHKTPLLAGLYDASGRIVPNQRRRGLTPKLMSYMSATAGCDREQSGAPLNSST
jgi:hypothetical protein